MVFSHAGYVFVHLTGHELQNVKRCELIGWSLLYLYMNVSKENNFLYVLFLFFCPLEIDQTYNQTIVCTDL